MYLNNFYKLMIKIKKYIIFTSIISFILKKQNMKLFSVLIFKNC